MAIQLKRESDGVYSFNGYTVRRRKWCAPSVCTSWDVTSPTGAKADCETLGEAREWIEEDANEQKALAARVLANPNMRRVHRFFR